MSKAASVIFAKFENLRDLKTYLEKIQNFKH